MRRWLLAASICMIGLPAASQAQIDAATLCQTETTAADIRLLACSSAMEEHRFDAEGRARMLVFRARAYRERGDLDAAFADLNQAITLDPRQADAYLNRGYIYEGRRDTANAFTDYDRAVRLTPDNALALNARGYALQLLGDLRGALIDLDQAITIDPNLAAAYHNRGWVRLRSMNPAGAIEDLTRAHTLDPQNARVLIDRAGAYLNIGQVELALQDANAAIALAPSANSLAIRANVHLQAGRLTQALEDYNRALQISPDFVDGLTGRGRVQMQRGRFALAQADYDRAVELAPTSHGILTQRGEMYSNMAQLDRAEEDLNRALSLSPHFQPALQGIAAVRMHRGDYQGALAAYNDVIETGGLSGQMLAQRGLSYFLIGDREHALADLERASTLPATPQFAQFFAALRQVIQGSDNDNIASLQLRANILQGFQAEEAALTLWDQVSARMPDDPAVLNNACMARFRAGTELDRALAACERALSLAPNNSAILDSRALVYLKQQRYQDAWNDFDAALRGRENPHSLYGRGVAALRLGREEGWADIDRAVSLAPRIALTFSAYGVTP